MTGKTRRTRVVKLTAPSLDLEIGRRVQLPDSHRRHRASECSIGGSVDRLPGELVQRGVQ